jgi:Uma2 family endonuclease
MATTRSDLSQRLSRTEFLASPEPIGEPAYERQPDGTLSQKMAPKPRHSAMQEELLFRFRAARAQRLAQAYPELRIVWSDENVSPSVPDVVVYRWERRPIAADGQLSEEATAPPDIAIEIVSPGQAPAHVGARCAEYIEHGVVWALMVDPDRRTAHLYSGELDPLVPRALTLDDTLDFGGILPDPPTLGDLFAALTPEL